MKHVRRYILWMVLLGAPPLSAQETFNIAYDNPFYLYGGARAHGAIQHGDTSIFIAGIVDTTISHTSGYLLFTDPAGNLLDSVRFKSPYPHLSVQLGQFGNVTHLDQSIYLTVSHYNTSDPDDPDRADSLMKLNMQGEVLWKKSLYVADFPYERAFYQGVLPYGEDGLLCFGQMVDTLGPISNSIEQLEGLLVRTDTSGNILWSKRYPEIFTIAKAKKLQDGGLLLSTIMESSVASEGTLAKLIRTDAQGNPRWSHTYGYDEGDVPFRSIGTPMIEVLEDGSIMALAVDYNIPGYNLNYSGPIRVLRIADFGDSYELLQDYYIDPADTRKGFGHSMVSSSENIVMVGTSGKVYARWGCLSGVTTMAAFTCSPLQGTACTAACTLIMTPFPIPWNRSMTSSP